MSLLEDMETFVAAVDAGSFSGAAARIGVAKSMVSRRIAALEARLGANLFARTTRRLSLTETGRAYDERARRILADVAEADEVAGRMRSALSGRLRVAAPMSFGVQHLAPAVNEFLALHPNLEIDLELNDRRVDLVSEGHDLAVRIGNLPDSALIARTLAPVRHAICASPAYLRERGEPATPEDLGREPHECLVYSARAAAEQWRFRVDGDWRSVRVRTHRLGVNNGEVLREAALAGLGLVSLPTFIVGDALRAGGLVRVLSDLPMDDPSLHAVWPPQRQLSAKVRRFVDFLEARFGSAPYWDSGIAL